jgi:ubiquinone/menaquinone biosynthesis C-methylase UbiE
MAPAVDPIVATYSRLARQYDDLTGRSCWVRATNEALASIRVDEIRGVVLDVGCGTGRALMTLAASARPDVQLIGIDPADNMRDIARELTRGCPNVRILDGRFENIPLASEAVDYLYSLFAFHWAADLELAVSELARVLKPDAHMDLFFIGRHNGREFIQATTPIFLKHMGPALLLESARLRKQLTREAAQALFARYFSPSRIVVDESYQTYRDTLAGHWAWWVRIEGQFLQIPPDRRHACDEEVRSALARLAGEQGIPYTIHQLHVRLGRA